MKRLLVTGAKGFLGRRIVEYFKEKYLVFAPSHEQMDITDATSVEEVFKNMLPDVVIHCAAVSDVGMCEREPERSFRINVEGSVNVARAAKVVGAKAILCSSDQVYFGDASEGAHDEEKLLEPANEYGRQKLAAEKRCLQENPDCVLLRLSWMYDRESRSAAEHGDFMRTLTANLDSDAVLTYPIHDVRGITDVNEVIHNLNKAFTLPGGVYNFGSPNAKNTYAMMRVVFENLGWDASKIVKNEVAFKENPRDISMCQRKINSAGIYFSDTGKQIEKVLQGE